MPKRRKETTAPEVTADAQAVGDEPLPIGLGPMSVEDVPRLALRLSEAAQALGVGRSTVERLRSAGRFPRPDMKLGKMPLWSVETLRAWIANGGRP